MTVYTILKLESRAIIFTAEIELILEEAVSVFMWRIAMTLVLVLNWCLKNFWDIMGQNDLQQKYIFAMCIIPSSINKWFIF